MKQAAQPSRATGRDSTAEHRDVSGIVRHVVGRDFGGHLDGRRERGSERDERGSQDEVAEFHHREGLTVECRAL
jgi:hypothetical protein